MCEYIYYVKLLIIIEYKESIKIVNTTALEIVNTTTTYGYTHLYNEVLY